MNGDALPGSTNSQSFVPDTKCPGMISQAGMKLNAILQDLFQNYDLELARKTTLVTSQSWDQRSIRVAR